MNIKPEVLKFMYGTKIKDVCVNSVYFGQIITVVPCPEKYSSIDSKAKVWVSGLTSAKANETLWVPVNNFSQMELLDENLKLLYDEK